MARRFIDSNKWDSWLRKQSKDVKIVYDYIWSKCDISGVWVADKELAEFEIGFKPNWSEIEDALRSKVTYFDSGLKWYVRGFLEMNSGEKLSSHSKVHQVILKKLQDHGILGSVLNERLEIVDRLESLPLFETPKKEPTKKTKKDPAPPIVLRWRDEDLPDSMRIDLEAGRTAVSDFITSRIKLGKPMTQGALDRFLERLRSIQNPISEIYRSIDNGWQDLYPKTEKTPEARVAKGGGERVHD